MRCNVAILITALSLACRASATPIPLGTRDITIVPEIDVSLEAPAFFRRHSPELKASVIPPRGSLPDNTTTSRIIISRDDTDLARREPALGAFFSAGLRLGMQGLKFIPGMAARGATFAGQGLKFAGQGIKFAGQAGAGAFNAARTGGTALYGTAARSVGSAVQTGRAGLGAAGGFGRIGAGAVNQFARTAGGTIGNGVATGGKAFGNVAMQGSKAVGNVAVQGTKVTGTALANGAKATGSKALDGFNLMWRNKMNTLSTAMLVQQVGKDPL